MAIRNGRLQALSGRAVEQRNLVHDRTEFRTEPIKKRTELLDLRQNLEEQPPQEFRRKLFPVNALCRAKTAREIGL
jgi:hypothetical protein